MAYNIECAYTPYSDVGVFSVYFGRTSASTSAPEASCAGLAALRKTKLGVRQLHNIKQQIVGRGLVGIRAAS